MTLPNAHVFEMFRQADASKSRRHGGMGIGLALVQQLVQLHGGTIAAESEGTNKGSRFTIRLPLTSEAVNSGAAAVTPPLALTGLDVILSDISMPGMDGFEFLEKLRKIKGRQTVPVIAITGFGRTDDIERARAAGFHSHLTKPLNIGALAAVLEPLTRKSFGRRRLQSGAF